MSIEDTLAKMALGAPTGRGVARYRDNRAIFTARPAGHAQGLAALAEPCVPEAHKNPYSGTHDVLGYAGSCLLLDRVV